MDPGPWLDRRPVSPEGFPLTWPPHQGPDETPVAAFCLGLACVDFIETEENKGEDFLKIQKARKRLF